MGQLLPKAHDLSHLVDSRIGNPDADLTEQVINGDFSSSTGWVLSGASLTISGGVLNFDNTATASARRVDYDLKAGKTYIFSFDAVMSGADMQIAVLPDGANAWLNYTALGSGTHTYIATASADISVVRIYCALNGGGAPLTIDNFSITEWDGEELVPDPDVGFVANDVSKWVVYSNNTIEQDGNAVKCTYVDSSSGAYVLFRNVTGTTFSTNFSIGDKIQVVVRVKVSSGASVNLFLQDDGGGGTYHSPAQTNTDYEVVILERTIAGNNFYIKTANFSAGESIWIEILSVKKISGLVAAYNMIPSP